MLTISIIHFLLLNFEVIIIENIWRIQILLLLFSNYHPIISPLNLISEASVIHSFSHPNLLDLLLLLTILLLLLLLSEFRMNSHMLSVAFFSYSSWIQVTTLILTMLLLFICFLSFSAFSNIYSLSHINIVLPEISWMIQIMHIMVLTFVNILLVHAFTSAWIHGFVDWTKKTGEWVLSLA